MAVIDLANLGPAGTTVFGADAADYSGFSVNSAGDVNGDGFDDLVIGANRADASGNTKSEAGETYVIFGKADWGITPTIDLASLGSAGITIWGAEASDRSGISVSSAGDFNGDGFDDLVIGANQADASGNAKSEAGETYVIFGKADWGITPTIDLASLGSAGITIWGAEASDQCGYSVSSAGDFNGDGFDDLVIGAILADSSGNAKTEAGDTYVIFGAASLPSTIDLANIGSVGIAIFGEDSADRSGISVTSAGDVNGDGFDDLVIGAYRADALLNAKSAAGDSYVIFGAASHPATISLASLGSAGITIFGADTVDLSGWSVSSVGDVNSDGYDDLIIGASRGDALGNLRNGAGESYVIFGAPSFPATIDLANLNSAGISVFGVEAGDDSGISVRNAGDVNGDGFDDLVIGARFADASGNLKNSAGDSYVIFGSASLSATIDLANLGSAGITVFGVDAFDYGGRSVSSAGDVNGDGFDDFVIGAYRADASGNGKAAAGESYVIFGGNSFTNSILPANLGTSGGNTITGSAGAEIINGANSNDTIAGLGGADILLGGRGDDILAVSDLSFKRIVGGNGNDTLRLDGSGHSLNLSSIRDNRIVDIEEINITGSGNNTLTLNQREVLNLSSHSNTLVVRRNAGDVVNIGSGWTQQANEMIGPDTFDVFKQGQATVKLQSVATSSIVNRRVFYNRSTSSIFGDGSGNPINSIDSTKTALLPGMTTSIANYTNYNLGLNGIVVDVASVGGLISAADLQFATWDGINVAGFVAIAAVPTVSILPGGGVSSSTRVKIEFADNAIRNTWLRITILANANTGLANNDVFYFGHAIGDMYSGNIGDPITVRTNATDTSIVRQNQSTGMNSVGVTSIHDLNKDGRVNATDTSIVRQNQLASIIRFFTAPTPPGFSESDIALAVDAVMADSGWLDELNPFSNKRRARA